MLARLVLPRLQEGETPVQGIWRADLVFLRSWTLCRRVCLGSIACQLGHDETAVRVRRHIRGRWPCVIWPLNGCGDTLPITHGRIGTRPTELKKGSPNLLMMGQLRDHGISVESALMP